MTSSQHDKNMSKETLQTALVIGGMGLQNARGCQNDGSQYSWRLPGVVLRVARGLRPDPIPVNNKIPARRGRLLRLICVRRMFAALPYPPLEAFCASPRRARDREIDRFTYFSVFLQRRLLRGVPEPDRVRRPEKIRGMHVCQL
jgi:hypothetical protein